MRAQVRDLNCTRSLLHAARSGNSEPITSSPYAASPGREIWRAASPPDTFLFLTRRGCAPPR